MALNTLREVQMLLTCDVPLAMGDTDPGNDVDPTDLSSPLTIFGVSCCV